MNEKLAKKHLLTDNLLILHLTDRCNNKCAFCMVDDVRGAFVFPYEDAVALVNSLPAGSKVDLFGGEPTMYPKLFDLLGHIYSKGMACSIASNGRLFSRKHFVEKIIAVTKGALYVRTSLYGLTAGAHDAITGVIGSYDELMSGLENIVAAGMPCQVNIVITRKNLPELEAMTLFIARKTVGRIKFGVVVDSLSCIDIVPSLSEIRPSLLRAVKLARKNGLQVTIEKAPLCLLPEYMNEFSSERDLGKWPRFFDDSGECGACLMRDWCDGLDPDYALAFGTAGISKIEQVSSTILSPFPSDIKSAGLRFLKFNLFRLPDAPTPEVRCEDVIAEVLKEATRRHSRVAFVPGSLTSRI